MYTPEIIFIGQLMNYRRNFLFERPWDETKKGLAFDTTNQNSSWILFRKDTSLFLPSETEGKILPKKFREEKIKRKSIDFEIPIPWTSVTTGNLSEIKLI